MTLKLGVPIVLEQGVKDKQLTPNSRKILKNKARQNTARLLGVQAVGVVHKEENALVYNYNNRKEVTEIL